MKKDEIKIKNVKGLIKVLKDISNRAYTIHFFETGYKTYDQSIKTLIKVLEETQ